MRSRARFIRPPLPTLLGAALWTAACGNAEGTPHRAGLTIFAASSLTEAFKDLEHGFEDEHPDVDVDIVFAGSQILRLQLEQGASADVFASANEAHMAALTRAGLVTDSRTFTHNELVVIVPRGNPAAVESFEDLPCATRLVIGTDNVPAGMYARQVIEGAAARLGSHFVADVLDRVVSEESNVRLVRAKVELGEADAAIVYRTDAAASTEVEVVSIPDDLNVRARYPIGVVAGSDQAAAARRFVDFVLSERGQATLVRHGFLPVAS